PDPDAGLPAAAAARGGVRLSRLPRRRGSAVGPGGNGASPADGAHAAGRDGPRRGRRHADGARGRHPGVEAVHAGVLPRRRAGRGGRRHRRADHVGLSGPGRGHAAACADRGDPRRRRQPGGRLRRQLHHRLRLHLRRRALPAARLRDSFSAHDFRNSLPPTGIVWKVCSVKLAALACLLVAFPLVGGEFYVNLASQIFIFAIFAASINLLLGYGGLATLGHASYLGVAAYTSALLGLKLGLGSWIAAPVALLGTTLMACAFGLIALRAAGLGFLMLTLALSQVLWGTAYRWVSMTDGDNGLRGLVRPAPFGINLDGATAFYYFALAVAAFSIWMMARFVNSPFGAALKGTRDQPRRMSALGHDVWMIRWVTFV